MPSATEFIRRAMVINGTIDRTDPVETNELNDGLVALNDMLDSWEIDRTLVFSVLSETFALVSGTASYTMGTAGAFNTFRPNRISNVFVTLNGVNFPVKELTDKRDYQNIPIKTNQGIPQYYYYDTAFPLGTLFIYPVINQTATITIDSWQQLTNFADLTTQYTFPPGYNRAINYNLAMELAPEDGIRMTPEATMIAVESKANVRRKNLRRPVMKNETSYLSNGNRNFYQG